MHCVINAMIKHQIQKPLAIFPSGTGNDLALELGIQSVLDTIRLLINNQTQRIDLGHVKTPTDECYMAVCMAWGFTSRSIHHAEKWRWIGKIRYTIAALRELLTGGVHNGTLTIDEESLKGPIRFF